MSERLNDGGGTAVQILALHVKLMDYISEKRRSRQGVGVGVEGCVCVLEEV